MKKQILDHGYIELIDCWGRDGVESAVGDEAIIAAARMSTGKGFLGWGPVRTRVPSRLPSGGETIEEKPGDEKLLRFLWENKHATPFEMAGLTVEVQAPIFVFREWHRHRTQCLSGDTMITCVSPRGTTYKRSIRSIFELKHGGVVDQAPERHRNGTTKAGTPVTRAARRKDPWRTRVLPNCQNRLLRVLNEETLEFEVLPMASVWESGVKQLWRLETETGRTIETSAEHPFFTKRGWVKMKHLTTEDFVARLGKVATGEIPIPPALRRGIGVWTSMMRSRLIQPLDSCYLCGTAFKASLLELDHVVPVSENLQKALDPKNLKPACARCHRNKTNAEQPSREGMTARGVRWERVGSITEDIRSEMTYDIQIDGEHDNFVANDLVVHNSYNEMSARYVPLPDVNHVPSVERLLLNSKTNKQAGVIAGAEELTPEIAELDRRELEEEWARQEAFYQRRLKRGVPKELARTHIGTGRYSRMRASANLRNWLAFVTLRSAPAAMWEIRQYSNALGVLLGETFPRTWEIFQGT